MLLPLTVAMYNIVRHGSKYLRMLLPAIAGFVCIAGMSVASHKEHRLLATPHLFLAPCVGHGIACIRYYLCNSTVLLWRISSRAICMLQILAIGYFLLRHQRGKEQIGLDAARYLKPGDSVTYLTPCHSTPTACTLPQGVQFKTLDCSPQDGPTESERFVQQPLAYVTTNPNLRKAEADALVLMAPEEHQLQNWLNQTAYVLHSRRFNADIPVDRMEAHCSLYIHPLRGKKEMM